MQSFELQFNENWKYKKRPTYSSPTVPTSCVILQHNKIITQLTQFKIDEKIYERSESYTGNTQQHWELWEITFLYTEEKMPWSDILNTSWCNTKRLDDLKIAPKNQETTEMWFQGK